MKISDARGKTALKNLHIRLPGSCLNEDISDLSLQYIASVLYYEEVFTMLMNSVPLIVDAEKCPLLCCLPERFFGMMEHGNSIEITFFQFFSQNVVPLGFD